MSESKRQDSPDWSGKAKTGESKKKKNGPAADLYSWHQALTFAMVLLVVLFTFVGRVIGVFGVSMEPTLVGGDMLLLQCLHYEPEQGDVVVLHKKFGDIDSPVVKRVIALEGQSVEIDYASHTVYVDGVALDEPYINAEPMALPGSEDSQGTYWEIPEGCVFVMGDNRNHSSDSRDAELGPIDKRYILGKAVCVLFPFQRIGPVAYT